MTYALPPNPTFSALVCEPVLCKMYCPFGFKQVDGCPACSCQECQLPGTCRMFCENGFVVDEQGCTKCNCKVLKN